MSDELFEAIDDGDLRAVRELIRAGVDVNAKHGILEDPAILRAAEEDSFDILNALIEAGADVHATDFGGTTALLEAARSAKVSFVERLVWAGADLERGDNEPGWTPLMWAIWWSCQTAGEPIRPKYKKTVSRLLEAGADPNHAAKDGTTPLMLAANLNRGELAELLLDYGADPGRADEDGKTAESIAASKGNREVLALLVAHRGGEAGDALLDAVKTGDEKRVAERLAAGADPNEAEAGRPALVWAAELGHAGVARALLAAGADPNPKTKGDSPLAAAVRLKHGEVARALAEAGANPNVKRRDDGTLLGDVVEWGDAALVRAMLAAGAEVNPKSDAWRAPLLVAATYGRVELVELLLAAGASPNPKRASPLARAASHGSLGSVRALLAAGADVKAAGGEAITGAAAAGATEVVEALLAAGADPNAKNEDRESALMVAADRGHAGVAAALVAAGARLDAKNGSWTPLHYAVAGGRRDVARLLVAAGARPGGRGRLRAAIASGDDEAIAAAIASGEALDAPEPGTRWTPLEWALLLGDEPTAGLLLDAGAPPVTGAGEHLVVDAAHYGRETVARRLVAAKENAPDDRAIAKALTEASKRGHAAIAALLLDAGADPNARDDRRGTSLMRAAEEGHLETVRVLLEADADPLQKDGLGMTIKDLAELREHKEIVELLGQYAQPAQKEKKGKKKDKKKGKKEKASAAAPEGDRRGAKALVRAIGDGDLAALEALLAAGADPSYTDQQGMTLLLLAMRAQRPDMVEALLAAGADPNAPPNLPPLIAAVGDARMREALLAAGADVNVRDLDGQTPLMVACWRGAPESAMRFIEAGADVTAAEDRGHTALAYACMHEHPAVALAILERGADVAARDADDDTPLYYAVRTGLGDVARELLERMAARAPRSPKLDLVLAIVRGDAAAVRGAFAKGASASTTDPFVKWPAIMWAALAGDDETLRAVLAAGGNPNAKKDQQTPARLVWKRGRTEAIFDLLGAGLDPNATVDPYSQALVTVAASGGDARLAGALLAAGAKPDSGAVYGAAVHGHLEVARMLVDAGAKLDGKDMVDRTPLLRALQNGHLDVARLLAGAGAPVDTRTDGVPMLSWSIVAGRPDATDLLLEAGASPNQKDRDGDAPLHHAVAAGDVEAVRRLLAAGASADVKNRAGRTPLAEAAFYGLPAVVEALLPAARAADARKALDLAASEGEVDAIRALAALDPKRAAEAEARARGVQPEGPVAEVPPPPGDLGRVVEDDLMRGLQQRFLTRLPEGAEVVYRGRYGAYIRVPASHLDEQNATATTLYTTAWSAERVGAAMARLGLSHAVDIVCDRLADVTSRLWAEPERRAYGALNVGLLGSQAVDFVTAFEDGAVLTTTTHEGVPPMPERGLFPRSYPKAGLPVLWHKHLGRVARRVAAGARIAPADPDPAAAARMIDDFLVRRMAK